MGHMDAASFWHNKRVFVTGHTGFKGAWLCLWLHAWGAKVTGYAWQPPTVPSLYRLSRLDELVTSYTGDIRNLETLSAAIDQASPDIVIHMAAQPIVSASYASPVETYEVNVMGTVHLLEAVRSAVGRGIPIRAVLNVTTDKCYDYQGEPWGFRESDPLGGNDPYSNSKACSELITASYREAYFPPQAYSHHQVAIATARAGNVIGGGDWAKDRLIPDCIWALEKGESIPIRNPKAVRPWQHVLEPLHGYLQLAQKLYEKGPFYGQAWNFGPREADMHSVEEVVTRLGQLWGSPALYSVAPGASFHEAHYLRLDSSKAKQLLGWSSRWDLDTSLRKTVEWYIAFQVIRDMREVCLKQIESYISGGDTS